jgi:oligoendopeptidase F
MNETNTEVAAPADNVITLKQPPRTVQQRVQDKHKAKADRLKKERREQLLKNKVPEQLVDQIIEQEEYTRLPIDQKVHHLQASVSQIQGGISQALRQMAAEMIALRNNQEAIADAFDINLKMIERVLVKLGIDEATQKAILEDVNKEFVEEKKKYLEEKARLKEAAKAASEAPAPSTETVVEKEFKAADAEATGIITQS